MFYLDFEEKLEKFDFEIESLRKISKDSDIDVKGKISDIEKKILSEMGRIYSNLSPWQIVKLARHPNRPKTKNYIDSIFSKFIPLFGDRLYSQDNAIIAGFAHLNNSPVIVLGTEKGNDMKTRIKHNFGMAKPEGYRKAQRIMKLASKLNLPLICFVDTSGAYPGKDAEERGQAEAIAQSMKTALNCDVPLISVIIGEGGSGGAIALATSDSVIMLSNSIYSVISPEGCSSILWKSADFAETAANSLKITAKDCLELKIIDEIIEEPIGGAHRHHEKVSSDLKQVLIKNIDNLRSIKKNDLIKKRNERYLNYIV